MESKMRRQRASSAKPSVDRKRPSSGQSIKHTSKVEFIQNLYGGPASRKQSKVYSKLGYDYGEDSHLCNTTNKIYKDSEQLFEENMGLKKQINNLKKELELQRGRTQVFRKKNSEYTKSINIEFQKEMYWNGPNANMVRGVKSQYELMKQKYEDKCRQFDGLYQECSFYKEDTKYIKALQADNAKLAQILKEATDEMKILEHGTINSMVEDSMDKHKKLKFHLSQQNQNLQSEVQMLKIQTKALKGTIEKRDKKIAFLQKLLIEKDNGEHAARKRLNKVQKQKQEIIDTYSTYIHDTTLKINLLEQKLAVTKENAERKAQQQIKIFTMELEDKNDRISKCEKEIAYLTTLLSYWKPLDEINEMKATRLIQNNNSLSNQDKQMILEYSIGSTMIKYNASKQNAANPIHIEDDDNRSITQSVIRNSRRGSTEVNKFMGKECNINQMLAKSIDIGQNVEEPQRVRITADKRHSQNSVKCRKIHYQEITDICETLKYRFMGLNVKIEQIRELFDYRHDEDDILMTEEEQNWRKTYINLEEAMKIVCKNRYFELNEEDGKTLARFLIEDSETDYVYCDPQNENLRTVVKSIIKNVVGDYDVFEDPEKIKKKSEDLIAKYETNLEPALKATAPKGLVSKKKLLEMFKGLGIELGEDVKLYLVGKLVIKSQNLSNLKYNILFER